MLSIASTLFLAALYTVVSANPAPCNAPGGGAIQPGCLGLNFTNVQDSYQEGVASYITWSMDEGVVIEKLELQHNNAGGGGEQYDTIVQWNKGASNIVGVKWTPSTWQTGPYYQFVMFLASNRIVATKNFEVLRPDGVVGDERIGHEIIEPQDGVGDIWPANLDFIYADGTTSSATSSGSTAAPTTSTPTSVVQTSSTFIPIGTVSTSPIASTVFSTTVVTVSSCAPTVTNCPYKTKPVTITTVVPCTQGPSGSLVPVTTASLAQPTVTVGGGSSASSLHLTTLSVSVNATSTAVGTVTTSPSLSSSSSGKSATSTPLPVTAGAAKFSFGAWAIVAALMALL